MQRPEKVHSNICRNKRHAQCDIQKENGNWNNKITKRSVFCHSRLCFSRHNSSSAFPQPERLCSYWGISRKWGCTVHQSKTGKGLNILGKRGEMESARCTCRQDGHNEDSPFQYKQQNREKNKGRFSFHSLVPFGFHLLWSGHLSKGAGTVALHRLVDQEQERGHHSHQEQLLPHRRSATSSQRLGGGGRGHRRRRRVLQAGDSVDQAALWVAGRRAGGPGDGRGHGEALVVPHEVAGLDGPLGGSFDGSSAANTAGDQHVVANSTLLFLPCLITDP